MSLLFLKKKILDRKKYNEGEAFWDCIEEDNFILSLLELEEKNINEEIKGLEYEIGITKGEVQLTGLLNQLKTFKKVLG